MDTIRTTLLHIISFTLMLYSLHIQEGFSSSPNPSSTQLICMWTGCICLKEKSRGARTRESNIESPSDQHLFHVLYIRTRIDMVEDVKRVRVDA